MIRKLTENDREVYMEMAKEFYHSDAVLAPIPAWHIEKTVEQVLSCDDYAEIFLLEYEGEDAGYALIAKTFSQEAGGMVWWIEELYVREKYRSKGLGSSFLDYIERQRRKEVKRLRLEVESENTEAISLYRNFGYKVLEYIQMVKTD